ncbi:P0 [Suakwa aphid-borne yellows virus]|uniref:P0 n=1 Tax=Suakwa aphid-borne yellows virus TaxID=646010 RepID=J7FCG6_9VIRU|nr:P0 [Suakwa aphid-borne yellows virus]AFM68942.1 P0 [Suakwa aphid-borne yellows virus]
MNLRINTDSSIRLTFESDSFVERLSCFVYFLINCEEYFSEAALLNTTFNEEYAIRCVIFLLPLCLNPLLARSRARKRAGALPRTYLQPVLRWAVRTGTSISYGLERNQREFWFLLRGAGRARLEPINSRELLHGYIDLTIEQNPLGFQECCIRGPRYISCVLGVMQRQHSSIRVPRLQSLARGDNNAVDLCDLGHSLRPYLGFAEYLPTHAYLDFPVLLHKFIGEGVQDPLWDCLPCIFTDAIFAFITGETHPDLDFGSALRKLFWEEA